MYWSGVFRATITIGGTTLTSAGAEDIFVSKWTPQGSLIWAKRFGGAGSDTAAGMAADATHVHFLANSAVDFGDGARKNVAKLTGSNGSRVWSRGCSIPGGSYLLRKFSPAGSLFWVRGASDAGPARLGPVAAGGPGNLIFTAGSFSSAIYIGPFGAATLDNTTEAYLARIDP